MRPRASVAPPTGSRPRPVEGGARAPGARRAASPSPWRPRRLGSADRPGRPRRRPRPRHPPRTRRPGDPAGPTSWRPPSDAEIAASLRDRAGGLRPRRRRGERPRPAGRRLLRGVPGSEAAVPGYSGRLPPRRRRGGTKPPSPSSPAERLGAAHDTLAAEQDRLTALQRRAARHVRSAAARLYGALGACAGIIVLGAIVLDVADPPHAAAAGQRARPTGSARWRAETSATARCHRPDGDRRARRPRRRDARPHHRGVALRPPSRTPDCDEQADRAAPLQRRAGAVRLRRQPRPAGAAAQGRQLLPDAGAAATATSSTTGPTVHRLRRRRRQADAGAHQRPAHVLPGRAGSTGADRDGSTATCSTGAGATSRPPIEETGAEVDLGRRCPMVRR